MTFFSWFRPAPVRQKFPFLLLSRSHRLTLSRSCIHETPWDALGRLVGRVEPRDRPMFIGLGTTGRLVRGVRVLVRVPLPFPTLNLNLHPNLLLPCL